MTATLERKDVFMAHIAATPGCTFKVRNSGAFVAHFSVSYKLGGQEFTLESGDITVGVNRVLEVPQGATDLYLKVEEAWFIASWSTILTRRYAKPEDHCFEVWGTTLSPDGKEVSC